MSYRLKWTLTLRDSRYDATAKHVGLTLATHMDADGYCWPGKETLAAETSLAVRAVDLAILRLEVGGWLRVKRSKGRHSNEYWAKLPNPPAGSGLNPAGESGLPRTRNAPTPHLTTTNPAPGAPELVMKGSKNSSVNSSAAAENDGDQNPSTPPPEAYELLERLQRGLLNDL